MISADLLAILCCPETHQALRLAEPELVDRVNLLIADGRLQNRAREVVREKLDAALIRADNQWLYPVRRDIPVMLIDEAIPLSSLVGL
jgi:uncharacterized protein